jgi:hypothetical protein
MVMLSCVSTFSTMFAQTVPFSRHPITRIEQVSLDHSGAMNLEIVATAPVSPQVQVLSDPDRLVLDFPDTLPGSNLHNLAVHRGGVKEIRVGLFSAKPSITRIVVDWNSPQPYQVFPSGKTVLVKLNKEDAASVRLHQAATPSATRRFSSRVEQVRLLGGSGDLEIDATGLTTPQTQVVSGPDRLVIDFPGALPGDRLQNLAVNRGEVTSVRVGLLSAHPPVTRVVVDLRSPLPYQLFPSGDRVMVKWKQRGALAAVSSGERKPSTQPRLTVSYRSGLLSIHADRATLGEVLNAVHRETGADIPIPLGIENEKIVVELGPARPSEVLTSLLNGTRYNFILLGSSDDPTGLRSVILTPRDTQVSAADFRGTTQQNQPPSVVSTPNEPSAGSFRNRNKESFISFPLAVTTPDPATTHSATPQPSAQPSDQELSTPPPAAPDSPQPPPRP